MSKIFISALDLSIDPLTGLCLDQDLSNNNNNTPCLPDSKSESVKSSSSSHFAQRRKSSSHHNLPDIKEQSIPEDNILEVRLQYIELKLRTMTFEINELVETFSYIYDFAFQISL